MSALPLDFVRKTDAEDVISAMLAAPRITGDYWKAADAMELRHINDRICPDVPPDFEAELEGQEFHATQLRRGALPNNGIAVHWTYKDHINGPGFWTDIDGYLVDVEIQPIMEREFMDTISTSVPTTLREPFAGGFYAGRILVDGKQYAIVVAPKAEGECADTALIESRKPLPTGPQTFYDGVANTAALLEAGSDLAKWATGLRIAGFDDWYIPSRDELELCYRAFKPTSDENWAYRGDNPSSVPVGYAYSPDFPAQTPVDAFKKGGAEAFETSYYWSSTQSAGYESYAWYQDFGYGGQISTRKDDELRARAVRRVAI